MLDYSGIDMEVSDDSVETAEFSECRKVLRVDKILNSILAAIYSRTWFSYKDGQKVIDLFI